MPYSTYNELITAVQAAYEDDSQEFLEFLPNALFAAQQRLMREIDRVGLKQNFNITTNIGNRTVAKPAGYRLSFGAFLFNPVTGEEAVLRHVTDDFIRDYWPRESLTGKPKYYATDYDNTSIIVAPTPDQNYILKLNCIADFTPLSSDNPTNYLSQYCGDALFYATMAEQARFAKDADKATMYDDAYVNIVKGINNEARRDRAADGQIPANPSQNTLMGDA